FDFVRSDSLVIETAFKDLNITSESTSFTLSLRQPLYRSSDYKLFGNTWDTELAMSVAGAVRRNTTFLLGERFSFSPGEDNGEGNVTAIRLGQELYLRNQSQAIAARSTFSIGIDALDATQGGEGDSQFLAWLGQFQYVRRLQ